MWVPPPLLSATRSLALSRRVLRADVQDNEHEGRARDGSWIDLHGCEMDYVQDHLFPAFLLDALGKHGKEHPHGKDHLRGKEHGKKHEVTLCPNLGFLRLLKVA